MMADLYRFSFWDWFAFSQVPGAIILQLLGPRNRERLLFDALNLSC